MFEEVFNFVVSEFVGGIELWNFISKKGKCMVWFLKVNEEFCVIFMVLCCMII